ncbi:leucine-rich repeat-containing protein 15-like [Mytilus californianus]|uniref:leucine-rich repeat-containing protein 15-like n=1 Tax=Mytilus californianus TaxID=6549 RepID=UPI002245A92D|nr:leucine-rich repeat-containing protein 15-like [Mytilus californianus]
MYQYIFLIVCSFVGSTVYGCPSSCSCRDTTVWCDNRNLSAIPSDIPHDSTYVGLSKNRITTIDANVFQGMTALQTLFMNENKITTVDANSFQGLTALTLLNLSYNKITKIDAKIFQGLTALSSLALYANKITRLDANIFQGLTALTYLDFDINDITNLDARIFQDLTALTQLVFNRNEISTPDANIFQNLKALTELSFGGNQISSLDKNIFQGLTALTYLWLANNQFTTLDSNLFRGVTALQKLYLPNNKITTLDANLFQGLTALRELHLGTNKITTLDAYLFRDLKALTVLDLEDNPLDCSNCELKTIKDFLKNNSNLGDSGAKCGYKLLIDHNFINCKDSETTEKSVRTSTTTTTTNTTTEYQTSTVESTTGIINTEVIIYASCGAGIFLILTCSIICFCVHKKCRKAHIYQNTGINQKCVANISGANIDDEVGISQNVSTGRESGHEYQQIDELEMSDLVLSSNEQRHITVGDNSSNSSDGIQLSTDGYLNPYESLLSTQQQSENTQDRDSDENTAYSRLYSRCTSEVVDEPI